MIRPCGNPAITEPPALSIVRFNTSPFSECPINTWHAPVSLETGTVVFEIKQGPYKPIAEQHLAPWAPQEGMPEGILFLEWGRKAAIGEKPPTMEIIPRSP